MLKTFTVRLADGDHSVRLETQRNNATHGAPTVLDVSVDSLTAHSTEHSDLFRAIHGDPGCQAELAAAHRWIEMFG